jgi:hypothetical protein
MLLSLLAAALAHVAATATPLDFHEFFEPSHARLEPTAKLLGLNGKRVRLSGFMVKMELPSKGAFYLAATPVFCDEAGGGTADLPPETVRVTVRSAGGAEVPFMPGPLEVSGVLEVGNQTDEDGRVSSVRLTLDRPQDVPGFRRTAASRSKQRSSNRETQSPSVRGSP